MGKALGMSPLKTVRDLIRGKGEGELEKIPEKKDTQPATYRDHHIWLSQARDKKKIVKNQKPRETLTFNISGERGGRIKEGGGVVEKWCG